MDGRPPGAAGLGDGARGVPVDDQPHVGDLRDQPILGAPEDAPRGEVNRLNWSCDRPRASTASGSDARAWEFVGTGNLEVIASHSKASAWKIS